TAGVPANIDAEILALNPSKLPERLHECRQIRFSHRIGRRKAHQHADTPRLLRPRRERPCCSRAAEQRDELAPPHSITSSARASSAAAVLAIAINQCSVSLLGEGSNKLTVVPTCSDVGTTLKPGILARANLR